MRANLLRTAATLVAFALALGVVPSSGRAFMPALRDVTYCTMGGVPVKMDVYLPSTAPSRPAPAVLYLHGGAWEAGDKSEGDWLPQFGPALVAAGYVVVAANYRLAPRFAWPAQIEDVKCAVRSLRANASSYHIDPSRIGAWGGSAGAHLVSLLATAGPVAGFDVGAYLDQSSKLQAVVDLYGPADLTASGWGPEMSSIIAGVFGSSPAVPTTRTLRASPVYYVAAGDPPFLILQGDRDDIVPPSQALEFLTRLRGAGVPAELVMVKNAGHALEPRGGPISPPATDLIKRVVDFFNRNLR